MALMISDGTGASGHTPLPGHFALADKTGQLRLYSEKVFFQGGDPGLQMSVLGTVLGGPDTRGSITSYRTVLVLDGCDFSVSVVSPFQGAEFPLLVVKSLRRTRPPFGSLVGEAQRNTVTRVRSAQAATPAEELRSISGLPPALLARLFGVSRTTFYKWMDGATPRDQRFQHLLDVLAHVKDAQRKLAPSIDMPAWLRTPISPGGRTPLDFLQQRRFSTFRGLLLRWKSASIHLTSPLPSALMARPLGRAEFAAARERISPSPRIDEDEDEPSSQK